MSRGVGDQGPRWGRAAAPPVASRVAQAHPVGPSSAAGTVISTRIGSRDADPDFHSDEAGGYSVSTPWSRRSCTRQWARGLAPGTDRDPLSRPLPASVGEASARARPRGPRRAKDV